MAVNIWSKLGFESKSTWQLMVAVNYFLKVRNVAVNCWSKLGFASKGLWKLIFGVLFFKVMECGS